VIVFSCIVSSEYIICLNVCIVVIEMNLVRDTYRSIVLLQDADALKAQLIGHVAS